MYILNKEAMCLTERQTDHVYKAIEQGNMINTKAVTCESMTCETNQCQDDNSYKKVVLNNVFKELDKSPEMKSWSIFSNNVGYVQHDQMTSQNLNIDTLDYRDHKDLYLKLKEEERETYDIDFGLYPDVTKSRYLDVYEGVYAEMVYANKFNENSDLSTTYLGQTEMTRDTKIKAKERFPITGQGFASGKLLDCTECQILLDTGATMSYMLKSYYLQCNTLHALPKFSSNTQRIQVGNGQYVSVLFVIPVIIEIHRHRFEIFTLVSEIHDNGHNRSSFHQRVVRYGHGKDFRHERANHKHDKIEIYPKQSSFEDYKQSTQNHDFWQNRNDGNCRFKITRLL